MAFKTDIEIAHECAMEPITKIAEKLGIGDEYGGMFIFPPFIPVSSHHPLCKLQSLYTVYRPGYKA